MTTAMTPAAPRYQRWAAWSAALLFAAGILTLWIPAVWPAALFQSAMIALVLLFLLAHAAAGGDWRLPPAVAPIAAIAAFAAIQLAAGWTLDPWATTSKLTEWSATTAAVVLLALAARHEGLRHRLLTALLVFSTLLAVQALLQNFTSGGKVFWLFDSGYPDNVLGPFVSRNKYAQFIEIVFPLALWRGFTRRRLSPLWLVAAAIMFAGAVAGASRLGFLILLLEVPAVLLLAWRREALPGRTVALALLQASALLLAWGFIAGFQSLWDRLTGTDPLADLRWPLMQSTWDMARAHPFTGAGLGAWPSVYPEFARFDIGLIANQAHCDWLQWFAEGGVVMALLLAAFVVLALPALLRSVWGVGFVAVCIHAAFDFPFHQLPAFTTFLFAAAMLAILDGAPGRGPRS